MENEKKKVNLAAFLPAIIILLLFITAGIIWTEQVGAVMTSLLYAMADYFGAYINLLSLLFVILAVVFIIARYGDVIIGGKDAKPEFPMLNWCAMSICSGIGTGLLFWAMGEPIYHYMTTPTAIAEAGSRTAAIFAVAQAMWDWSFVQYCMYAICGAAFAIICYNRRKSLSFNSIVEGVIGKKIPWLNTLVTAVVIFWLMGATSNSMGVGLMQIGIKAIMESGKCTAVTFTNVPAFAEYINKEIEVPHIGHGVEKVKVDVCWGGMYYVMADVNQFPWVELTPDQGREITRISSLILRAAQDQLPVANPDYPGVGITISQLYKEVNEEDCDVRNAVTVASGAIDFDNPSTWIGALDRCPCGTGTCARMAAMWAKGQIKVGESFRNKGLLGVVYRGDCVKEVDFYGRKAIIPAITGEFWIYGYGNLVLDSTDPFEEGFTIGDIWA